ncbi:hypothetical protein Leryth_000179 [Lithospermum erythrorhizon]|uniref:Dof zinc finger protein n=1 Tax=Lithospermum erythrorhizon TaxID=34254 RepID=A0AAV3QB37_LITER|nr:hypothetical protein Leryth_000179 [Lithospermum erythrorhizon]
MDAAQWPQGIGLSNNPVEAPRSQATTEKKPRPQKAQAVNCPRCNSTNTKFCYYNNYNLSQPRYFCKTCRRYWTEGGTLRNVPVGGGSRKNKRSISTSTTSSSSSLSKKPIIPDLSMPSFSRLPHQNPKITHHGSSQDLNLAYPPMSSNNYSSFSSLVSLQPNPNNMDFLKNEIPSSKGLHTFMSMPISDSNSSMYSSGGIPLHAFKPNLNFSLDGFDNHQNVFGSNLSSGAQDTNEKIFLPPSPLDDLKQVSSTTQFEQHRGQGGQDTNNGGYWNGMYGGYSW